MPTRTEQYSTVPIRRYPHAKTGEMNEALEKEPVLPEDVLLSVSIGSKTPPSGMCVLDFEFILAGALLGVAFY